MELAGWNWPAIAALAVVALAVVTMAYAVATCFFIRSSFQEMDRAFEKRARDRKQAQGALEAEQRRAREELTEWRRTQEAWREADERRHKEAMEESRRRGEEGLRRHEEAMAALAALIERTGGPRPAPAE